MPYQVQKGDTIAKVLTTMKIDWKTLRRLNPDAIKQSSKTGNWFLKEGATVKSRPTFEAVLSQTTKKTKTIEASPKTAASEKSIESTLPKTATSDKWIGYTLPKTAASEKSIESTLPKTATSEKWIEYTIKPGDTLWSLAVRRFHVDVKDIVKDNKIEDPRKIKPGQVIRIRQPIRTQMQPIVASWYGTNFHGRPMANGDQYDMYADTIAHRQLPLGTRVELENPQTGQKAKAVVTDRGPYVTGRDVDLSYGLAQKLNLVQRGVGGLVMRVLG